MNNRRADTVMDFPKHRRPFNPRELYQLLRTPEKQYENGFCIPPFMEYSSNSGNNATQNNQASNLFSGYGGDPIRSIYQ